MLSTYLSISPNKGTILSQGTRSRRGVWPLSPARRAFLAGGNSGFSGSEFGLCDDWPVLKGGRINGSGSSFLSVGYASKSVRKKDTAHYGDHYASDNLYGEYFDMAVKKEREK